LLFSKNGGTKEKSEKRVGGSGPGCPEPAGKIDNPRKTLISFASRDFVCEFDLRKKVSSILTCPKLFHRRHDDDSVKPILKKKLVSSTPVVPLITDSVSLLSPDSFVSDVPDVSALLAGGSSLEEKKDSDEVKYCKLMNDFVTVDSVVSPLSLDDVDTVFEVNFAAVSCVSVNTSQSTRITNNNPHGVIVEIGKHKLTTMIDSGASVSLINRDLLRKLNLNREKIRPYFGPIIVDANHNALNIQDVHRIKFTMGDTPFEADFIDCANLNPDILLGADFLSKQKSVHFDYLNMMMKISDAVVHLSADYFGLSSYANLVYLISTHDDAIEEIAENIFPSEGVATRETVTNLVKKYDLDHDRKELLTKFLLKNVSVFAQNPNKPGTAKVISHSIDTGEAVPVRQRPYRTADIENSPLEKAVKEMLENGIIRESSSDWASPVIMVKKKDGSMRFCVDFRKLNSVTKKDSYPLPLIEDLLNSIGRTNAKCFSKLDLASGYWQIPVAEKDIPKTAFITQSGLYEFVVMAFGLTNAPATFQRAMDKLFHGLSKFCLVYLDDIIIFSPEIDTHFNDLEVVFSRLKNAGFHAKLSKCSFLLKTLPFLGHLVTETGIRVDPDKFSIVKRLSAPSTAREVREFLGITGFYRRFIKDYAHVAVPLHLLTRKENPFVWTDDCQIAFDTLKNALVSSDVCAYPDFSKPFDLDVDASGVAIGTCLSQNGKVIAYGGRVLSDSERRYDATHREAALAVVYGCRKYRTHLLGKKFNVYPDHNPLVHVMKSKDPTNIRARWAVELSEYELTPSYLSIW
jgi:hypothetical protein